MVSKCAGSIGLLIILFIQFNSFAQSNYTHFRIDTLAPGVYAAINSPEGHAICNAGIIDTGEETLVFDTFLSPLAAKELKQAAESLTHRAVRYVVNSHHHNDHIRGNALFVESNILATQITADLIASEDSMLVWSERKTAPAAAAIIAEAMQSVNDENQLREMRLGLHYNLAIEESANNYQRVLPNHIITDSLVIRGSLNTVVLKTLGGGHTASDLFMWLPACKVLFAGDLVFNRFHPWLLDGNMDRLDAILKQLKTYPIQTIVPGHGNPGNAKLIDAMIHYNDTIRMNIKKAQLEARTEDYYIQLEPPREFIHWSLRDFFIQNIRLQVEKD